MFVSEGIICFCDVSYWSVWLEYLYIRVDKKDIWM